MQCKSLWIKASAKCINVNVNISAMTQNLPRLNLRPGAADLNVKKRLKVIFLSSLRSSPVNGVILMISNREQTPVAKHR